MLSLKNKLFPRNVSTKGAIGISMMLHIFIAAAFGAYWAGSIEKRDLSHPDAVVLEFEPVKFTPNFPNKREYGVSNPDAQQESGKASNRTKGNMNRVAILKASLASMEDFISPFKFVAQTMLSDSTGGFSPVDGDMPGSQFDSYGTKRGEGVGRGSGIRVRSGGGTCKGPIVLP